MTVYVEAEKAARELGVRQRGGFFDDNRDEDFTLALVDGAFAKALVVQLVRKVEGKQFYEVRSAMCCSLGVLPCYQAELWTILNNDARVAASTGAGGGVGAQVAPGRRHRQPHQVWGLLERAIT